MSEFVSVLDDEEGGINLIEAIGILSLNAHRETTEWHLVEKQCFKNGRLEESQCYVETRYETPHEHFEPTKFLVFEVRAMAKAYVMEEAEEALLEAQSGRGDDPDD